MSDLEKVAYGEIPAELIARMIGAHTYGWVGGGFTVESIGASTSEPARPTALALAPEAVSQPLTEERPEGEWLQQRFDGFPALAKLAIAAVNKHNPAKRGRSDVVDDFLVGEHLTANPRYWTRGFLVGDSNPLTRVEESRILGEDDKWYGYTKHGTIMPTGEEMADVEAWAASIIETSETPEATAPQSEEPWRYPNFTFKGPRA